MLNHQLTLETSKSTNSRATYSTWISKQCSWDFKTAAQCIHQKSSTIGVPTNKQPYNSNRLKQIMKKFCATRFKQAAGFNQHGLTSMVQVIIIEIMAIEIPTIHNCHGNW
jgi:hypothetical protein